MNRVFKTKWSVAHQEYVVTDEKHASKTKAAKSVVALAVAALMLGAGAASAAYMEKGQVATSNADLEAAKQSWQSDEYKKDWGLEAMKVCIGLSRAGREGSRDGLRCSSPEAS